MGQKDPLEKGLATLSSILAWEIPWKEDPSHVYVRSFLYVFYTLIKLYQQNL